MTPPSSRWNVGLGILLVARGRPEGLRYFDDTRQAVLSSLAPLVALLLVVVLLALFNDAGVALLVDVLILAIGLLATLVLSYEVARRWGRADEWYRFAVAYCWCHWRGAAGHVVLLLASSLLIAGGVPADLAVGAGQIGLLLYALWLYWFLARHALSLSAGAGRRCWCCWSMRGRSCW
ncbi:MAG: hypothetical protein WDN49_00235 [Acetobacteraceae bacterium]